MSKENIDLIKRYLKSYTIETTPNVFKKYVSFSGIVDKNHAIYITYLPNENYKKIIDTAKKIKDEGFEPIPHLPARTIKNFSEVEKYLGMLSEISGAKKILIIGGSSYQNGNISSSMEILETGLIDKFNFTEVGLAGHPEGSPDISDEELDRAIIEKNKFVSNTQAKLYFVTQFFFETSSFITWEKHLEELGNKIDIHAGLPGPANILTLINFAKSCGIRNSINFLSKQALKISKLASTKAPGKLVYELSKYKNSNSNSKLTKLHFYPFGGMKKTSRWIKALVDNEIRIDQNNDIEITNFDL